MAGKAKPGTQGFVSTAKVKAEFVDAIPQRDRNDNWGGKKHMNWESTPGVKEALLQAYQTPGKAMLLLQYDEGAPSRRRTLAELRVGALQRQGYNEENGWVVKNVENRVYVLYQGVPE